MDERFELSVVRDFEDWRALQNAFLARSWTTRHVPHVFWFFGGLAILMTVVSAATANVADAISYAFMALLMILLQLVAMPWLQRRQFSGSRFADPLHIVADQTGIRSRTDKIEALHRWDAIRRIDVVDRRIILWVEQNSGLVLPERAFSGEDEAIRFVAYVRARMPAAA